MTGPYRHHLFRQHRAQSGYALLMVIFFAALMLVAASTVGLKIATQGQREREMELEWRGKQYVRGVKLFTRKNGRFPKSLEDLTKGNLGIRYMRKGYKDPFNTAEDGGWRLIYVGPAGQLIGSVKAGGRIGLLPTVAGAGVRPVMSGATPAGAMSAAPRGAFDEEKVPAKGMMSSSPTSLSKPATDDAFGSQNLSTGVGSDGTIIGGNIIGVASKIDKPSIRVYEGAQTYREWEFIYDPAKDRTTIGQPGMQLGAPAGTPTRNPNSPFRRDRRIPQH